MPQRCTPQSTSHRVRDDHAGPSAGVVEQLDGFEPVEDDSDLGTLSEFDQGLETPFAYRWVGDQYSLEPGVGKAGGLAQCGDG